MGYPKKLLITLFFLFSFLIFAKNYTYAQESATPVCEKTTPAEAPDLYQVSVSSNSATLYFVETASEFDGYTISYGLEAAADSYSVSFSQTRSGSATSYTINDIYSNTAYYFKVRANNGCAAGPWSSIKSNMSSLPETGPGDLFGESLFMGTLALIGSILLSFYIYKKQIVHQA